MMGLVSIDAPGADQGASAELLHTLSARIHTETAARRALERKLIDVRMKLFETEKVREDLVAHNQKLQIKLEKFRLSSPQLSRSATHEARRRSSTATE
jgi:hypothetical protein